MLLLEGGAKEKMRWNLLPALVDMMTGWEAKQDTCLKMGSSRRITVLERMVFDGSDWNSMRFSVLVMDLTLDQIYGEDSDWSCLSPEIRSCFLGTTSKRLFVRIWHADVSVSIAFNGRTISNACTRN